MTASPQNVARQHRKLLSKLDVTADTLEAQLQDLIDGVEDLEAATKTLGFDLRELPKLLKDLKHSDDAYHRGETIMEHTRWVLEDVESLTADMPKTQRRLLRVVALLHDLGKAITCERDEKKCKYTFKGHDRKSVDIAKVLLARFEDDVEGYHQQILDMVREHDAFFRLADARPTSGNTKYLRKFLDNAVRTDEHLRNLAAFARADSARARTIQQTLEEIDMVLADVGKHRAMLVQQELDKEEAARKQEINIVKYHDEIAEMVDAVVPGLSAKLPDRKAVFAELGGARAYGVLQQVQAILAR